MIYVPTGMFNTLYFVPNEVVGHSVLWAHLFVLGDILASGNKTILGQTLPCFPAVLPLNDDLMFLTYSDRNGRLSAARKLPAVISETAVVKM